MPEDTPGFHRLPLRDPDAFTPKTFRTLAVGSHRVIVGYLKGEKRRTRSGRLRLTIQAVLHPKGELIPGCRGCIAAKVFLHRG